MQLMKVTLFAFTSRLRFPLAQSLASSNTPLLPFQAVRETTGEIVFVSQVPLEGKSLAL